MPEKSFNSATTEIGIDAPSPDASRQHPLHVVCVMLSRGLGGLEQSAIDYAEALSLEGHRVTALVHPDWPGGATLDQLGVARESCTSLGEWDPLAAFRLRRRIGGLAPAVVVTIGRRASALVRRALGRPGDPPQVAATPNYGFRHLIGLDHVIATTADIGRALIAAGQPAARISVVPNTIRVPADPAVPPKWPVAVPVIGALGRFVSKKGFAHFIDALACLRARGHGFKAMLAGSGPDETALRERARRADLEQQISFPGWVTDKTAFFRSLDVFCVPSVHEPFGIVVLEGLAHGRPTVVTDAEGPRQIVTDGVDGLVVPRTDPERLADALASLIEQPALRHRLGETGLATVRQRYDLPVVASQLARVLRSVATTERHRAAAAAP